ncbi:MAG: tRNA preQ1(34) S-adenosylmethionine ribosyltransferase-isomerase QueA [Bdellovibrio sp.]|nr:tRNA preQ1(34) S-adenosylmethionine ribosyltransferase-isomerase QueA [Methylotenera sp.]
MKTQDFDFYLPDVLIAQHPTKLRTASRLLHLCAKAGQMHDRLFVDLPNFLNAGDLLIFNDTRVINARLFGHKATGGAVELLVERVLDTQHVMAHIRASRAPKAGAILKLADAFEAEVISRDDDLFYLKFLGETPVLALLEQYGALPLPPYITHAAEIEDHQRYQTVYAKHTGAVAAPTAGLHFDEAMLDTLKAKGVNIAFVTLHVGAGTFQPVRVDNIAEHKMHSEIYHIPAETADLITSTKAAGHHVIAVGTTSLRTLESAAVANGLPDNASNPNTLAGGGETNIFITPGFQFKVVDKLITNFHLPKSTLLMLVSAFAGFEPIKNAYAHAVKQEYRFFSYGDAMFLERRD